MKKAIKILSFLCIICILACCFIACDNVKREPDDENPEVADYAGQITFDPTSGVRAKCKVTVNMYIDGDTTHFNVPTSISDSGILKARYLAVNTPESTGKIEDYGHAASRFTKEKLSNAKSIYVESNDDKWNLDTTGSRFLVWVWYQPEGSDTYRNLNIELLQNGLGKGSSTLQNCYGETALAALNAARDAKLLIYSGVPDPEVFRGNNIFVTIKELRTNISEYVGKKVAVEGVVALHNGNSVYIEDYDQETDTYFGFTAFYGYNLDSEGLRILAVGNRVLFAGSVEFRESGGTYQLTDLDYSAYTPDDPNNLKLISEGNVLSYREVMANEFYGNIDIEKEIEDADGNVTVESTTYAFGELSLNSTISMNNLVVKSIYVTNKPGSSSNGAMTITCEVDGRTVSIRTIVLYDEKDNLITPDAYEGKTINVRGCVDYFEGKYQIKVFRTSDITIVE